MGLICRLFDHKYAAVSNVVTKQRNRTKLLASLYQCKRCKKITMGTAIPFPGMGVLIRRERIPMTEKTIESKDEMKPEGGGRDYEPENDQKDEPRPFYMLDNFKPDDMTEL